MYTACLFCHADLGRNEALEAFPVGRRLAYDAARGRLWVVCRRCERWNLTPQEARWEAIEQAERLYRGTRLRASTDHVGLARLEDGTELVRVGAPLRPEFAAWRYGDQFGRRRRRWLLRAGAVTVAGLAIMTAGPFAGVASLGSLWQLPGFLNGLYNGRHARRRFDVIGESSASAREAPMYVGERARLVPDPDHGFALLLGTFARDQRRRWYGYGTTPEDVRLHGAEALRVAGLVLPYANRAAGGAEDVRAAVALLDHEGSAGAVFTAVARHGRLYQRGWEAYALDPLKGNTGMLLNLAPRARLALEMAAHEEQERRALEGELRELESAWKQAEEIAAIADGLLLPEGVDARLDQLKASSGRSSARAGAPSSPTSDSGAASSS